MGWISGPLTSHPVPLVQGTHLYSCARGPEGLQVIMSYFQPFLLSDFSLKKKKIQDLLYFFRTVRLRPLTWYIDKRCHGVRARESFDERSFNHFQSTTMVCREAPELVESWVMRPGWRAMAVGSCLCKALLWWAGRLEDRLNKPKKNIKRQIGVREKMNSPWSPREITEVMTQQSGFKRSCYSKKGNFVQLFFFFMEKRMKRSVPAKSSLSDKR